MKTDQQMVRWALEESSEPVIKNPYLVGTPTKEVTQHGRRIYETPEGEEVSEKSTTIFLNGLGWINIPSIHGGRAFNDDQLRGMIKRGEIQPTSVHQSKPEAEEAAGSRSNMMKRHEKGFAGGQLVQPGPGRPGYAGLTDGRTTSPLISKEKLKKLRPKFNIKEIAEKTKTSTATVNRLLKKYDLLGQGSYIPGGYRGYVSPERLKLEKKLPQIRKLYLVDKLSEHQIAKKLDTVPSKIEAILNEARGVTNSAREPERKKLYKENKITEAQFKKRGSWPLAGTPPDIREKVIKDSENYSVREVAQRNKLSDQTVIKIAKEEKLKFPYRAHVLGRLKEHVTEDANKLLNVLRKDTKLIKNMEKAYELAGLNKMSGASAIQALKAPTVLSGNVPRFKFSKTDKKIVEALTPPRISAEAEALKAGVSKADVRAGMLRPRVALQEYFAEGDVGKRGTVFEHAFPRSLIPYIKDKKLAKQLQIIGERTSPFLNDFKIRYDRLQKSAVDQFLKDGNLSQYNKTINQIRDTVRKATGGYEIGYIKFDKNKNPTPVVKSKPITEGIKQFGVETTQKVSGFKNSKSSSKTVI